MCGWGTPFQLNLCQLWIFLFKMVDNLGPNCQFTWKIMTSMTFSQPVVRPTRKPQHFSVRNGASKLSEQRWQMDFFFWFTSPMVEFTSRLRRHLLDRDGSNRLGTWVERSCTGIKVCKNSLEFSCSSKVMTLRRGRKRQIEGTEMRFSKFLWLNVASLLSTKTQGPPTSNFQKKCLATEVVTGMSFSTPAKSSASRVPCAETTQ